ncbi:MAG: HAMP domain-containing sensor histidine kinase [Cyanobacteria bacterium P01_E01_bin.45]
MFQSTRRRLALWYSACTAVLLLLFASCFYVYVRATLIERVDDTLNHVVEVVEQSLVFEPISFEPTAIKPAQQVNLEASFKHRSPAVDDDRIDLEWFSPEGDVLWSTFPATLTVPRLNLQPKSNLPSKIGQQLEQTVTLSEDYTLSQLTTPIRYGDRLVGYLRASHPWFEVTKPTRQLVQDLALGVTGTLGIVGVVGWFLSGLAIAPVIESYQTLKQFTADASHELRSPIASMQTNVQVALSNPDLEGEERRNWLIVERLSQRLGRLVDDLLFLARQDTQATVQPQCCALDVLVLEVVEEQRSQATARGIDIAISIGSDREEEEQHFAILGNDDDLLRLIGNLLNNAIRYTPEGKSVEVALDYIAKGAKPFARLQVKDSGIGIPLEAIPKLFDRFYRVDASRSRSGRGAQGDKPTGSGLGLAIVKAIVERYEGQIQVESTVGQGSCFSVLLPVADKDCNGDL